MNIDTSIKNRDDRLRRLMMATGENTKTKALFLAVDHYLADLENKERVIDDLVGVTTQSFRTEDGTESVIDVLSTGPMPLSAELETHVGREGRR